jgi:hypothetical protein
MAIANISNNARDICADRTCLDSMNNEVKIGSGAPLVSNADSPALYNATTALPLMPNMMVALTCCDYSRTLKTVEYEISSRSRGR